MLVLILCLREEEFEKNTMGRTPCCDKKGLKKGPWSSEEDEILIEYIKKNGCGSWRSLPKLAGSTTMLYFLVFFLYTELWMFNDEVLRWIQLWMFKEGKNANFLYKFCYDVTQMNWHLRKMLLALNFYTFFCTKLKLNELVRPCI